MGSVVLILLKATETRSKRSVKYGAVLLVIFAMNEIISNQSDA